jgi:hypothetical protein
MAVNVLDSRVTLRWWEDAAYRDKIIVRLCYHKDSTFPSNQIKNILCSYDPRAQLLISEQSVLFGKSPLSCQHSLITAKEPYHS